MVLRSRYTPTTYYPQPNPLLTLIPTTPSLFTNYYSPSFIGSAHLYTIGLRKGYPCIHNNGPRAGPAYNERIDVQFLDVQKVR